MAVGLANWAASAQRRSAPHSRRPTSIAFRLAHLLNDGEADSQGRDGCDPTTSTGDGRRFARAPNASKRLAWRIRKSPVDEAGGPSPRTSTRSSLNFLERRCLAAGSVSSTTMMGFRGRTEEK